MNEQVRRYINRLKCLRLHGLTENAKPKPRNPFIVITPDFSDLTLDEMARWSGNPGNYTIEITDEDLEFVTQVRRKAAAAGIPSTQMPTQLRALQAKYALLVPPPLNNYDDPVEEDGVVKIYEVGHRGARELVATVDDAMRDAYKRVKQQDAEEEAKKAAAEAGAAPTKKKAAAPAVPSDMEVARWWIEDNRNAIHDGNKIGGTLPNPAIKIVRRGTTSVDLAFKSSKRFYGWVTVRDIPIDMPEFRKQAEARGYNDRVHARRIIKDIPRETWNDLISAKDQEDKASFGRKRSYNLGYKKLPDDPSEDYSERYDNDIEFRKHVEKIVIRATNKHVGGIFIDENQVDEKFGDDDDDNQSPWERGLINYKIGNKAGYTNLTVRADDVYDIMNEARRRILAMSGYVTFDWKKLTPEELADEDSKVNHFLRKEAANAVLTSLHNTGSIKKKERQVDGGGEEGTGATALDTVTTGTTSTGAERSAPKKQSDFAAPTTPETEVNAKDFLVQQVKPKFISWMMGSEKPDERTLRLMFKFAKDKGEVADAYRNVIEKLRLSEPETGDPAKYAAPTRAEHRRYSFRQYLEWRMGGR